MTEQQLRFCPRCGTGLVAGLAFCPGCGFNTAAVDDGTTRTAGTPPDQPADALGRPFEAGRAPSPADGRRSTGAYAAGGGGSALMQRLAPPGSRGSTLVISAVIVAIGLVIFGLLIRPQGSPSHAGAPQGGAVGSAGPGGANASQAAASPLIVGLTIDSPLDGQAVATKEVTVIGRAPPGLTVTNDISFGLDKHATSDGTGHWAIAVDLKEGRNDLVFRIGDDRSTEKRLRVVYQPQQ